MWNFPKSIKLSIQIQHMEANHEARKSNTGLLPKIRGLRINLSLIHYKGNDSFQCYYRLRFTFIWLTILILTTINIPADLSLNTVSNFLLSSGRTTPEAISTDDHWSVSPKQRDALKVDELSTVVQNLSRSMILQPKKYGQNMDLNRVSTLSGISIHFAKLSSLLLSHSNISISTSLCIFYISIFSKGS